MTHKPLGRGLGALLSSEQSTATTETIEVDIEQFDVSSVQPRTRFDEVKLQKLAQSIRSNGIVQPLLARRRGLRYELIAGERRWRAAKLAGLRTAPTLVRDVPDEKLLELALIENIQREDLNAIEEAKAYKSLLETIGLTQESLAERIGRDRSYVTNYIRLLKLPESIQEFVQQDKISTGHARALLAIGETELQRHIARKIIDRGLSVRDTESMIRDLNKPINRQKRTSTAKTAEDPNVRSVESKLRRHLGCQVKIIQTPGRENGVVQLAFYNLDELNRICEIIGGDVPKGQPASHSAI